MSRNVREHPSSETRCALMVCLPTSLAICSASAVWWQYCLHSSVRWGPAVYVFGHKQQNLIIQTSACPWSETRRAPSWLLSHWVINRAHYYYTCASDERIGSAFPLSCILWVKLTFIAGCMHPKSYTVCIGLSIHICVSLRYTPEDVIVHCLSVELTHWDMIYLCTARSVVSDVCIHT